MGDFSGRGDGSSFCFPGAAYADNNMESGFPNNLSRWVLPLAPWEAGKGPPTSLSCLNLNLQSCADGNTKFLQLPDHDFDSSIKRFCNLVFGIYERS